MQLYLLHVHWKPSSLFLAAAKVCQIMSREFHCCISHSYSKSWVSPLLLPSYVSFFFLSFYSPFVAFLCFDFLLPFPLFLFGFLLPFLFSSSFFTSVFIFVFRFLCVSSLAYPNLFGTKRLGCCYFLFCVMT
jgi:hypothetical protein